MNRIEVDGEDWTPPANWKPVAVSDGRGGHLLYLRRDGRLIPLGEAPAPSRAADDGEQAARPEGSPMTKVQLPAPVKARFVDSLSEAPAGSFRLFVRHDDPLGTPPRGINFSCPCGCGRIFSCSFERWKWNGDRAAPTLTPSIVPLLPSPHAGSTIVVPNENGNPYIPHWHGWLRAGEWVQA